MTHMTFRDDEEEKEDEDAAIADDALDEIGDDFAVDDGLLDTELALTPAADEDDEDEKDVDFDRHDDIDPI
jgi:hypothetical protein